MFIFEHTLVDITEIIASSVMCNMINPKSRILDKIKVFVVLSVDVSRTYCDILAKNIYASEAIIFRIEINTTHGIKGFALSKIHLLIVCFIVLKFRFPLMF